MSEKQEMFDRVWNHFVVERNPPSMNHNGACQYRGPNGARCAAGLFISDEEYCPEMEGAVLGTQEFHNLLPNAHILRREYTLAISFQSAHDTTARSFYPSMEGFLEILEKKLRAIARNFDLTVPGGQE